METTLLNTNPVPSYKFSMFSAFDLHNTYMCNSITRTRAGTLDRKMQSPTRDAQINLAVHGMHGESS